MRTRHLRIGRMLFGLTRHSMRERDMGLKKLLLRFPMTTQDCGKNTNDQA